MDFDDLLLKTEVELLDLVKPTTVDWQLRHRFWDLIKQAQELGDEKVYTTHLFDGICTERNFYNYVIVNPGRLAWMMRPIGNEKAMAQEAYHYAMLKIKAYIMKTPVTDENLGEFTRAAKFMADRGHGAVAQKIEQKTLSARVDLNRPQITNADELKKKIEELETTTHTVIDVEAT